MQVNKYLSKLPTVDLPPAGAKSNSPLGSSLAPTTSVVVSIDRAASAPAGALTVSRFLANLATLTGPIDIADTAANIAKNLNALNASGALAKIGTVSQLGTPSDLAITYNQWTTDNNAGGSSVLTKLGSGSNNVRVSGVDDSNLATVTGNSNVVKVGVVGVAITDLSSRLTDPKVSTIGVTGLSQANLSDAAYVTNLRNVKVTSIGVLNVPSASLNTVLNNAKVKTVTVTGVLAKDVGAVGSRPQVTSMTVSDTSTNLATNFNALIYQQSKITTVTQSPKSVMNLTGGQFKVGTNILAKIDSGDYQVNLKNVLASDVSTFVANVKVLDVQVTDSGLNIGRNFDALSDAKITKVAQASLKDTINISAAQYTDGSAILSKLTAGSYSLAITNLTYTNANDLKALTDIPAIKTVSLTGLAVADLSAAVAVSPKVSAVQISDTAAHVNSSLNTLRAYVLKIGQISNSESPSGTRANVVFTPTTYNSILADKLTGFSTVVDYDNVAHSNNSSLYSVTTDSKGVRTIAKGNVRQSYSNNVNFFKFSDKNLFGTTGNKNVDAVLLGGTKNWWYDAAAASTSDTQINGVMNSLSSTSSKHALTFSFLNSTSITGASNQSSDSNGFIEMSADQKVAVKKALDYISTVTNLTFSEASASGQGDLNFGTNDQGTASGAYAYNPHTATHINVMLNNHAGAAQQANATFTQGSYGWETLIHEIAHSIGLKHPGNYNAGGGGTVGPYLPTGDAGSRRYTIMSYNNPVDGQNVTATDLGNGQTAYTLAALNPKTLMTYDIAALQFLYGVNTDASGLQSLQNTRTESASATFQALASGQTVTMAGLTFTAGTSGVTANELATAFSGITATDTLGAINTRKVAAGITDVKGIFTGAPSGWTSGTASTNTVVFSSTTTLTNVQNLVSTGTVSKLPTISTIDGAGKKSASVALKALAANQSVTLGGLTFTAGNSGASANDVANAFQNLTTGAAPTSLTARDETATATFGSGTLAAGQTLTLNGLTWTAGSGGTSQANLEKVFGSLNAGTTRTAANTAAAAAIGVGYSAAVDGQFTGGTATVSASSAASSHIITFTASSKNVDDLVATGNNTSLTITTAVTQQGNAGGTYTGSLTGWNTSAATNNTVNFTVQSLSSTGTANKQPVITVNDTVGKESESAAFRALATTEYVTIGGLRFTAGASGASANDVAYAFQNLTSGDAPTSLTARDETATATFTAGTSLSATKTVTLNGLTWTAGSAGISADDLASAFQSIAAGTAFDNAALTTATASLRADNKGYFSLGTSISASSATAIVGGNKVVTFTATNSNVSDLTATLSATPGTIAIATATTQQGTSGGAYSGTFTGWSTGAATNNIVNFTSNTAYVDVPDLASTASTTPTITTTNGAARTATASAVFKDLVSGDTVTLAGVTFTAGGSGATKNEVAIAFSALANGATAAQLNALHSLSPTDFGSFTSGPVSGWVSGTANGSTVVFTSTTAYTSGQSLSSTGTANKQPVITVTDGAVRTETASVQFKPLATTQSVTLGGLTFTPSASGATANEVAAAFSNLSSGDAPTVFAARSEISTAAFGSGTLVAGDTVTLNGLTWTAGADGTTRAQLETVFGSIAAGTSRALANAAAVTAGVTNTGAGTTYGSFTTGTAAVSTSGSANSHVITFTASNADVIDLADTGTQATPGSLVITTATTQQGRSGGTYTGTFTGWSTGAASNDTVNFTSSTVYADVQDLASTLSNSPTITTTNGVDLSVDAYQTTVFTSGWRGFESLYIPETQSDETLDLSALSNKSIIDLRAGAFSSINILPPETKTALPTTMLRSAQTYMGLNNVALAYGAEVNTVKGGNSSDSYFVSDYNVSINDSSGSNQVFLNGKESDWLSSNIRSAETAVAAFKPLSSGQTVTMAGLTFTAGTSGVSANELATAFSGITGSDTLATINSRKVTPGNVSDAKGVFTGTPSGWTSGAASTNTVVFTSTTASSNVENLASAGTSGVQPTIANTDGAAKIYINTLTGQSVELIGNFTIRYYDADKQALTHSNLDLMV